MCRSFDKEDDGILSEWRPDPLPSSVKNAGGGLRNTLETGAFISFKACSRDIVSTDGVRRCFKSSLNSSELIPAVAARAKMRGIRLNMYSGNRCAP